MSKEKNLDIANDIKLIIAKVLKVDPDQIKAESLLSELAADSLDVIELVFLFEEKFDISIVVQAKGSSFTAKMGHGDQVRHVQFNTVGEIIQTVQQIIDAKAT